MGDTLFAIGALGIVVFVFGLGLGYSLKAKGRPAAGPANRAPRLKILSAGSVLELTARLP